MNKLFSKSDLKTEKKQPIIVVSGLQRSGTSMMMKMLAEGGLSIVTDEVRRPDDDNPNGYYELEAVKQLRDGNFDWLNKANGKAVKIISSLLEFLPPDHQYKIIFMERESREVLSSQKKMLEHRGEPSRMSDDEMEQQFHQHLTALKPWLVRQPNMEVLSINYNELVAQPGPFCEHITDFLGLPIDPVRMLAVPDKQLYRNRAADE